MARFSERRVFTVLSWYALKYKRCPLATMAEIQIDAAKAGNTSTIQFVLALQYFQTKWIFNRANYFSPEKSYGTIAISELRPDKTKWLVLSWNQEWFCWETKPKQRQNVNKTKQSQEPWFLWSFCSFPGNHFTKIYSLQPNDVQNDVKEADAGFTTLRGAANSRSMDE